MTTISELEVIVRLQGRQIAALQSEVDVLKASNSSSVPASVAQRVEPEGVRITYPIERSKIALPNTAELKTLLEVVLAAYPKLRGWSPGSRTAYQDEAGFIQQFSAAFRYVSHLGRDEIDQKHAVSWWTDAASEWCKVQNIWSSSIGAFPFLCAVIGSGDTKFTESDHWGNSWSVGLSPYGGTPATGTSWHRALNGQLLKPSPGVHKAITGPSPVVRFGGDAR